MNSLTEHRCIALGISKMADYNSALVPWSKTRDQAFHTFTRQALSMIWDFCEVNPFVGAAGDLSVSLRGITRVLGGMRHFGNVPAGQARNADAQVAPLVQDSLISTDPPYYDNIGYSDLSDFFYVWLRSALGEIAPRLFATMLVPKAPELVATPYRHGGRDEAEAFFLRGMTSALRSMAQSGHRAFPVTIYYAFKQSETGAAGTASTGWETFLEAVLTAGFSIVGTWPMRTERGARTRDLGSNALASSIVLVCRERQEDAGQVNRRTFLRELESELPVWLTIMTGGAGGESQIAPVDLPQAMIGPGMAIFSKHDAVLEADGTPMTVHNALIHINKAIESYFSDVEGEMDSDTRFCVAWFQHCGFDEGAFGDADNVARAKGTSVDGLAKAGVLRAGGGKVELLSVPEYPDDWDPQTDERTPIWEACHHMCRALQEGETAAGELLAQMPDRQEAIRQLAYRLYVWCDREKKYLAESRYYNELMTSWPAIVAESRRAGRRGEQTELF